MNLQETPTRHGGLADPASDHAHNLKGNKSPQPGGLPRGHHPLHPGTYRRTCGWIEQISQIGGEPLEFTRTENETKGEQPHHLVPNTVGVDLQVWSESLGPAGHGAAK